MTDVNLTEQGQQLADFLDVMGGPLGSFILKIGIAVAIVSLVVAVIYLIKKKAGMNG